MTDSLAFFAILADIEDLLEILVPIAFIVIYLIGNAAKSMLEKKEQDHRQEKTSDLTDKQRMETGPAALPSQKSSRQKPQPAVTPRAQRLPYARSVPAASQKEPTSIIEKMEEAKQRRLAQIRARQSRIIKSPSIQKQPVPQISRPVQQPQRPVPVAKPVPVAQSIERAESAKGGIKPKTAVSRPTVPGTGQDLIRMLRNPKLIRNAVVASEILGKPLSLR